MTPTYNPYDSAPTTAPEREERRAQAGDTGTALTHDPQITISTGLVTIEVHPNDPSGRFMDPINFAKIEDILSFYDWRDLSIYQYLVENKAVVALLFEAIVPLRNIFDLRIIPSLEIFEDIDSGGHKELFVMVPIPRADYREGMRKLRQFDQSWFIREVPRVAGKLNVDIELV